MKTSIIFLKIERQIKHTSFRKGANKKKYLKVCPWQKFTEHLFMVPSSIWIISLDISMSHLSSFMFPGEGIQLYQVSSLLLDKPVIAKKKKQKNKKTHKHSYHSQILPQDHSSLYRNHFEEAEIISITNYSKNIY